MKVVIAFLLCIFTAAHPKVFLTIHSPDDSLSVIDIEAIQEITFDISGEVVDREKVLSLAKCFTLLQNYPNPFNPITTITFQIPQTGKVDISIFDITGRLVLHQSKTFEKGSHSFLWDGTDERGSKVASGFYIYQVSFNNTIQTKKMTLVK